MSTPTNRLASIDIFRAITMMLMIFVNDLWSLRDIPDWLGHTQTHEDGMGLADVVFPAFLFIVGLSVPMAIEARQKKGENKLQVALHIGKRSFALVVMGVLMVNLENINRELIPISKQLWQILMAVGFMLIWNNYKDKKAFGKVPEWVPQLVGMGVLVFLCAIYAGGTAENPAWLKVHWWGILGLIGWAYFFCSIIYLLAGGRLFIIAAALLALYLLNIHDSSGLLGGLPKSLLVVGASNHASVMSGIFVSLLLAAARREEDVRKFVLSCIGLAAALMAFGFVTRPEWGISKNMGTPSWVAICAGISTLSFLVIYLIADVWKKTSWAAIVAPAGRSTLTCYLVPYWFYPIFMVTIAAVLPSWATEGLAGIVKSLLFSLLVIYITSLLEKVNIRLKV